MSTGHTETAEQIIDDWRDEHSEGAGFTRHRLNPTAPTGLRHVCIDLHHEPATYNPWFGVTFCRCGHIRWVGNRRPFATATELHEAFPQHHPDPRTYPGLAKVA